MWKKSLIFRGRLRSDIADSCCKECIYIREIEFHYFIDYAQTLVIIIVTIGVGILLCQRVILYIQIPLPFFM